MFFVEQSKMVKYFGIFVAVIMAFSMITGIAFMILNDPIIQTPQDNSLTEPNATTFNYTLSFDANAIRDLSSFRVALMTSFEDKALIDAEVKKVEGVSTIASQFRKDSADSNSWIYFAEITLKKNSNIIDVLNNIYSIDYFDANSDRLAMKHMTINVPKNVMLHNTDLNIERNYTFTTTTLSTLASVETLPGDLLTVEGTIQLQGSIITSIELIESVNKSAQERFMQEYQEQITEQNITLDLNQ